MTTRSKHRGWAEQALSELAAAGYRRGGARESVIELLDGQSCALSAIEIEDALRREGTRRVARASVYRILEQLEELRLVSRVDVGHGLSRFEAAREEGHHHHMVCDQCGDVTPFEDTALEQSIRRVTERVAFDVVEHEVVLHGACANCRG
jgi:Fur family ferric uptake transcriptional regulator